MTYDTKPGERDPLTGFFHDMKNPKEGSEIGDLIKQYREYQKQKGIDPDGPNPIEGTPLDAVLKKYNADQAKEKESAKKNKEDKIDL